MIAPMPTPPLEFDIAPYRLSGVVYGTLLNHPAALAALGSQVHEAPYHAPPRAPVLYVKPRNTLNANHAPVVVPLGVPELEIGANLGIVIGRTACRVPESAALDHVAGYTIVNDISVPHDSFYRPSVRLRARDGFCPLGPAVIARDRIADADALAVGVFVDGTLVQRTSTAGMRRSVCRLLADVTEFMTLAPGDLLLLGAAAGAPRVRVGQAVAVEIEGLGRLESRFVAPQGGPL